MLAGVEELGVLEGEMREMTRRPKTMDEPKDDGGQAFPRGGYDGPDRQSLSVEGMTLRDWFAGQALQGMLANEGARKTTLLQDAEDAYDYADAMIKWRTKSDGR